MSGDLGGPFQKRPAPEELPADLIAAATLSGGVTVMAATAPIEGGGLFPLLVFRFAKADGSGYLPPIILGCDDVASLKGLVPLIEQAVDGAIQAANL